MEINVNIKDALLRREGIDTLKKIIEKKELDLQSLNFIKGTIITYDDITRSYVMYTKKANRYMGNTFYMCTDLRGSYFLRLGFIDNEDPMVLDFKIERLINYWVNIYIINLYEIKEYKYSELELEEVFGENIQVGLDVINHNIDRMIDERIIEAQTELDVLREQVKINLTSDQINI